MPHPQGDEVDIAVERAGENVRVTVEGVTAGDLADGSVRFGRYLEVNAGGGVEPRGVRQRGDRTTLVFPAEGTGLEDGGTARFFARRDGSLKPVRGTATVESSSETSGSDAERGERQGQGRGKGESGRKDSDADSQAARADDDRLGSGLAVWPRPRGRRRRRGRG